MGKVAYRLALPPYLSRVHNVFHVSMLRKYELAWGHILKWPELQLDETTSYEEQPIRFVKLMHTFFEEEPFLWLEYYGSITEL